VTVYVRDFRLNDAQVEQLSESLYRACTGNGAAAPRIVVNGRATRGNDAGDNHAS
jgi:hypothetical protein